MIASYGVGRYVASEGDLLCWPSAYKRDGTKRGIVYCHGAGETASSIQNSVGGKTAEEVLIRALVDVGGFPLVSCDLGTSGQGGTSDTNSWGNTNAQTRVGQAITWLQGATGGGAKTGKVLMVAISMGNATMINYAKNNAANVAAMVGVLPVSDLDDIRDNNRGTFRAQISNAWGTGAWTANGTPALPAGANPATSNSGANGIPYRTYYASDDAVVIAATVTALTTAIGGTATNMGTGGHSDASVGNVPIPSVVDFLRQNA